MLIASSAVLARIRARAGTVMFILAAIQGIVGVAAINVIPYLLPLLVRDLRSDTVAGWLWWVVQLGCATSLIGWKWLPWLRTRRGLVCLLAGLAVGALAMAAAPALPVLFAAAAIFGASSVVYSACYAAYNAVAATHVAQRAAAHGGGDIGRPVRSASTIVSRLAAVASAAGSLALWGIVEIGARFGWRGALCTLGLLALVATVVVVAVLEPARRAERKTVGQRFVGGGRARWALLLGSLLSGWVQLPFASIGTYQSEALTTHGLAGWIGPFGLAIFAGAVIPALSYPRLHRRPGLIVLAAATITFAGAGIDLAGQLWLGTGSAGPAAVWGITQAIGLLCLEVGTTTITYSLAPLCGELFGAEYQQHFLRWFSVSRSLTAMATAAVAIPLFASGGWDSVTTFATFAGLYGLIPAAALAGLAFASASP